MLSTIIFLNGVGSSGKSSIARELQALYSDAYLHVGVDNFLFMMPEKYGVNGEYAQQGVQAVQVGSEQEPRVEVRFGPVGKRVFRGMRHAIAALANAGNNLIVDEILLSQDALDEYIQLLSEHRVIFVGVRAPLDVLEKRERERGDRKLGLARGQVDLVHKNKVYDIEVDSSKMTPRECALQIKAYAEGGVKSKMFKE